MRVVIDTNIAFSAILNSNGKIAKIILQPKSLINLYSTKQLLAEIDDHRGKLKLLSSYSDSELSEVLRIITNRIKFIEPELIPISCYRRAELLTVDSDIDDAEFVALTDHIKRKLWTGDKQLMRGLLKKKWNKLVSTDELYAMINQRRRSRQ